MKDKIVTILLCIIVLVILIRTGISFAKVEEFGDIIEIIPDNNFGEQDYINSDSGNQNYINSDSGQKPIEEILFSDVKKSDWYYNSVKYVYTNNIIQGTTTTTFKPNDKLTRGQLATILWRMEGMPSAKIANRFPDVKSGDYYYEAVRWASEKKVVNGYKDGKFGPKDNITREQLAVMLQNYARYKKRDVSKIADIFGFKDVNGISSYAKNAVAWAIQNKIISGKENGTKIDPKGNASRAEAAAMIQNYRTYVK